MEHPPRLHDSLGYHLSLAARIQQRRIEEGLRPLGLARTHWAILAVAGHEGLHQPSDIADHLGIDRTATSRALRRMEADGLIARTGGDGDGRTRSVSLTKRGRTVLAQATPVAARVRDAIAAQLTDTEQQALRRLLQKITAGAGDRPTHL